MEARFIEVVGEQHTLVLEMPDEACPVLVDHDRVEQIMINLLDNAAKYSPGGGEIVVRLRRVDDGVLLSVRDVGVGLPAGSNQLIFEAYGRAANAEQWGVPGMGLGLHICSLIVERHGGRIAVHSDGELQTGFNGSSQHGWVELRWVSQNGGSLTGLNEPECTHQVAHQWLAEKIGNVSGRRLPRV
jgi:signal transduction histidine kinase